MLKSKIVSSLEKVFLDSSFEQFAEVNKITIYRNSDASFQLLPFNDESSEQACHHYTVRAEGDLAQLIRFRCVENVPNYIPFPETADIAAKRDSGFLRTTPGLYPDILVPLSVSGRFPVVNQQLRALWVDVKNDGSIEPGEHTVKIILLDLDGIQATENEITIRVIDALLPKQKTKVAQWFYADCIADYYGVKVWSKKHFEICRRFIEAAVQNGINMILVPIFTPPLDTEVGRERTTTQLVGVRIVSGDYQFDFSLVDKWLDLLLDCGVEYFEMSHLFTQWGGYHAPKIICEKNGRKRKLFGWETDASSEEYVFFLRRFLREFTAHLNQRGLKERTYFHISDEPDEGQIEQYRRNKENLADVLRGWKTLDAFSHISFYKQGLCEIPVPSSSSIDAFLRENIKERWVYYCCGPYIGYSNRFLGMHAARTRFMGVQMYKYGIAGFLHWGYNFYNNQGSFDHINPLLNSNAGYWGGGGDAASIYPWLDGIPLESVRLIAFKQGLEDIRALELCEQFYKKAEIVKKIEEAYGEEIVFSKCANDTATMQRIRDVIDEMIICGQRTQKRVRFI